MQAVFRNLTAAALAAAVVGVNPAHAAGDYHWETLYRSQDQFGNDNFNARYHWHGSTGAGTVSNWHDACANQWLTTAATIFGSDQTLFEVEAHGGGYSASDTNKGVDSYLRITMADKVIHESFEDDAVYDKSYSKTFFTASDTFMVGPVPVTVTASIRGGVRAGAEAHGHSNKYLGNAGTWLIDGTAKLYGGADAKAHLSAFAGVPGVLGVGVSSTIGLIDVSVTPETYSRNVGPLANGNAITAKNRMPFTITSLDGKVEVWAQVTPLLRPRKKLIDWDGYKLVDKLIVDYSETIWY